LVENGEKNRIGQKLDKEQGRETVCKGVFRGGGRDNLAEKAESRARRSSWHFAF